MRANRRVFTLPPVYWKRNVGPLPARYAMATELRNAARTMRERDEALEKVKDLECEIAIRSLGARARIERADAAERQLGRAKAVLQEFVDHYPMGINPWLDAACRNARAILAGETT